MIQVDGTFIPNLDFWVNNLHNFEYNSGSTTLYFDANEHYQSGATDSSGLFSVDVYPTIYQFTFNNIHRQTIFFKDFRLGEDFSTVAFAGKLTTLSGTTWK